MERIPAGLYTYFAVESLQPEIPRWTAYLSPTYWGVLFFLLSTFPLLRIPEIALAQTASGFRQRCRQLIRPLGIPGFFPMLLFGCWLQAANGFTQSPQHQFQIYTLGLSMFVSLGRDGMTRVGQWALGTTTGRLIDRLGARKVVAVSLLIVSAGSLCYGNAEPETWWWIYLAAAAWIFWIGVNIGISDTLLAVAPVEERTSCFALYFTASTLSLALTTLLGGYLLDLFRQAEFPYERCSFLAGWAMRVAAVPLFLWATWKIKSR
ncbi:MAG TPA: hypothetical protein DEB39_00685 [Planctomycetaceae bacterium]|nr:hypothetical protein [Planctomycetaceae bacterium]